MYLEGYVPEHFPVRLVGRYGSQDTLRLKVWAGDNQGLSHLVYSLGPPANVRDSVAVPRFLLLADPIEIPIRSDWIGKPSLTVYLRDRAGLKSEEYASPRDSLHILPVRSPTRRSVDLDALYWDMSIDAEGRTVFLALPFDEAVAVVSLQSMTEVARIPLAGSPRSLDLSPDGKTLAVALHGRRAIAFLDTEQLDAEPKTIPFLAGDMPMALRYASGGKLLVLVLARRPHVVRREP
jgi:hypothetical protein